MEEYSKEMILKYEQIILDTSSAMHYQGFKRFVETSEKVLSDSGKKIFIPKVVWLELIRAYNSRNEEKEMKSAEAISIISSHRNIFKIEDERFYQDEMEKSFADPVLLSCLILKRGDSNVLLITNDRKLSKDANELNNQESCMGHEVATCYISVAGNLKPGFKADRPETKIIIKERIEYVEVPSKDSDKEGLKILGGCLLSAAIGAVLGVCSKNVIRFYK